MTTATVSVMFTDMVGSTALMSRIGPDAHGEVRRKHFELLRGAVASFGGTEVKSEGDALMVVFASASEALGCGVAMHQRVERNNRRAAEPVGLRVAIAVGETNVEDGDYFGPCVVEAARLVAVTEEGQLLVSGLVALMMSGRLGFEFGPPIAVEAKGFPTPLEARSVQWRSDGEGSVIPMPVGARLPEGGLPTVGRAEPLEQLGICWKQAVTGSRQVVFVSGEPGIGKTRLASEVAHSARDAGGTVLFGRCDEDVGVAYQPFAEALGHYVATCPREVLTAHVATFGGVINSIIPELGRRLGALPPAEGSDPQSERRWLFDGVTALLTSAAEDAPLLLILDDLHWASTPTLLLFRHLLRSPTPTELLVLATYRDTDLKRTHPLADFLADLRRSGETVRLPLQGLDKAAVRILVEAAAGAPLDDTGIVLAGALHAETEGNPFFAGEVLRHLADHGGLGQADLHDVGMPEGIREVIGRRLSRLSDHANKALAVASVIGPEFELRAIELVAELSADQVLDAIDEAIAAGLMEEIPGAVGRCRFAHALVRQTLYEESSSARRAQLHRRVGDAIESLHANDLEPHLAVLAYHHAEGARSGDSARAVDFALRAGAAAVARTAFEEAEQILERGLSLYEEHRDGDQTVQVELLLALADARVAMMAPGWRETALQAANVARSVGSAQLLARCAVMASRLSLGVHVPDVEALCEEALDALGEGDDRLRALLLAALSTIGKGTETLPLARRAVEAARRSGDLGAQAGAYSSLSRGLQGSPAGAERFEVAETLLSMGRESNNPIWIADGLESRGCARLAAGDRAGFVDDFELLLDHAEKNRTRFFEAIAKQGAVLLALLDGRFDEVEPLARAMVTSAGDDPSFQISYFAHMAALHGEQGRLAEFLPTTLEVFASNPWNMPLQAFVASCYAQLGDPDEARRLYDPLLSDDCALVGRDFALQGSLATLTETCVLLGDVTGAATLLRLMAPFGGQVLILAGSVSVRGAVDRYIGMLETLTDDFDAADEHFRRAVALEERIGGVGHVARTRYWHARLLQIRGAAGDHREALALLASCVDMAARLGMATLEQRARGTRCRVGRAGPFADSTGTVVIAAAC